MYLSPSNLLQPPRTCLIFEVSRLEWYSLLLSREDQLSKSELPLQGAEKVSFGKVLVQVWYLDIASTYSIELEEYRNVVHIM